MSEQGGTSSAASCANGHVFIYAGNNYAMPDGWPCVCGMTKYKASTTANDPQEVAASTTNPMPLPPCGHGYINGYPCQCSTSAGAFTTNEPQAAYGKKREPMLSNDGIHDLMPPNNNIGASVDRSVGGIIVRDHYERLISSGELIVKSELVVHLEAMAHELDELGDRADTTNMAAPYDWKHEAIKDVLDHINKKGSDHTR